MDRLKQLWECYKSLNPVFDPTGAQQSDTSTTISTIINPETLHNHITPYTDSKLNNCMSMSNTSFSCHTQNHENDDDQPKDKIDHEPSSSSSTSALHNNLRNTANHTEVAAVSSYTLTESCNHNNKFIIVNSNEVEVIGNIFLISFSFFLFSSFKHLFREDISSLQTNLQTLSNKLIITNPSITSAPTSLLTQSNLLSSLNLTNINSKNNQDKLSKVDSIYDSIISTTADNMSSLSHSLTNQISAIKDTYSLPTYTRHIENSGQDQILVREPSISEG